MFSGIRAFLTRIFRKLFPKEAGRGCHYIHGPEALPPPLTKEEEAQVMENIRQGIPGAREPLITHNLRLVVYIAKKFESPGAGVEDLISIGTIGLIKAVNTFQVERNIKLATYASRCIENEILMHLRKSSQLRHEVSIDDPLNVDWDGNELLLSDLLGSDPDAVNRDIEQEAECTLLRSAVDRLSPRERKSWFCASVWNLPGNILKKRWPINWASPNLTFPGWRSASSTGFGGIWKKPDNLPTRKMPHPTRDEAFFDRVEMASAPLPLPDLGALTCRNHQGLEEGMSPCVFEN